MIVWGGSTYTPTMFIFSRKLPCLVSENELTTRQSGQSQFTN